MSSAYEVVQYNIETLVSIMADKAGTSIQAVEAKPQRTYLESYLRQLSVRTIVVENAYTDRDYLEDFAAYYVRCFKPYGRQCTRLHFFSVAFSEDEFRLTLRRESSAVSIQQLQSSYLGFLIVKPLPQTVIGRTCLKTYSSEGRRYFPVTHEYVINLFGIKLTIESLAFQEQDTVAAACATSALWSAFHGTSRLFQHRIPTPFEITTSATAHSPSQTRTFPNSGLSFTQMAEAIRGVGLEPFLINATDEFTLKGSLYAYVKGKIPVIMGMALMDPADVDPDTNLPWCHGFHAVTVTGYSLGKSTAVPFGPSGLLLKATRIDKIYAHDDHIGPFCRMESVGGVNLDTSWTRPGLGNPLVAYPDALQIPVYHKIRIPYTEILNAILYVDTFLEDIRMAAGNLLSVPDRLEWDIYLTASNALREELQTSVEVLGAYLENVLTLPLPKYIWRATALSNGLPFLDLIFDTTDIVQGALFVTAIDHVAGTSQILKIVAEQVRQALGFEARPDREVIKWFADYQ